MAERANDRFPVTYAEKIVHLVVACGHDAVAVDRDRNGDLVVYFSREADADAREYQQGIETLRRLRSGKRIPSPDELVRALSTE